MLKEILRNLKLSEKEIAVYLSVLKLSPASNSQIAMEAELPRQTVYSIITDLANRGFIEQTDKKGVKQFIASPEDLLLLIDKMNIDLNKQKDKLKKALPKIMAERGNQRSLPKVIYFEGNDGIKRLFRGIIDYYKKGGEKRFRGYGVNNLKSVMDDYIRGLIRERHGYGVKTNLFIGRGPDDFRITGPQDAYGRMVKKIEIQPQRAAMYLVGESIYLFSYQDNVGIMIENKNISDLLKGIFDDHWSRV